MEKVLDENLIVLDADVETAEDCIKLGGKLLLENGYVKPGYIEAVIEREKVFPTGLRGKEIAIAIPHTENTFVNKPAVAVIIPKKKVEFCAMGTNNNKLNCEIVLPLVVKDPHKQVDMLKQIMRIIQDTQLLRSIRSAKNKEEILDYLSILNDI